MRTNPNNPRKCKNCPKKKKLAEMIKVPAGLFCSTECITEYATNPKNIAKGKAKVEKEERKAKRERRTAFLSNDKPHQEKLTQKKFNELIRLLDSRLGCISCAKPPLSFPVTCGHFKTVGSTPEMRFLPRNGHGQCSGCNQGQQKYKKGDSAVVITRYKQSLVERFGQEFLDDLERYHEPPKFTCEELIKLRSIFSKEVNRLNKGHKPSRDWRAYTEVRQILKDENDEE